MNLNEVVDLLKEMVEDCASLNGNDFLIAPSKLPNSSIDGYEIHMTGKFNQETLEYLSNVALKRRLAITQHPDSVMLYRIKGAIK